MTGSLFLLFISLALGITPEEGIALCALKSSIGFVYLPFTFSDISKWLFKSPLMGGTVLMLTMLARQGTSGPVYLVQLASTFEDCQFCSYLFFFLII